MTIEQAILEQLKGRTSEKPIKASRLCLNVFENGKPIKERILRKHALSLRQKGYPILAGNGGYWIAESLTQIEEWKRTVRNHARSELKLINLIEKSYPQFQENLF